MAFKIKSKKAKEKEQEWVFAEWIDKSGEYHSGMYMAKDRKFLEKKLNKWASKNEIKSYGIRKSDKESIWSS